MYICIYTYVCVLIPKLSIYKLLSAHETLGKLEAFQCLSKVLAECTFVGCHAERKINM